MTKKEWYKNRILWKAKQHKLFEKSCLLFDELSLEQKNAIKHQITPDDDEIVLVFWNSDVRWTALTVSSVYSFYENSLKFMMLDEINKNVSVTGEKMTVEFLELDNGITFWAPCGAELFALMNILMIFPLKHQS